MIKRALSFILIFVLIFSGLSVQSYAATDNTYTQIRYLEDGGYIITTITEETLSRSTSSKTATKRETRYNGDGSMAQQILLRGEFTYTGTTSTCTSSTITVNIYDTAYSKDSSSAWRNGNTAYGSATIKRKVLGVTVATNTYNLSVTCDANGNLS